MKTCTRCSEKKNSELFSHRKSKYCRECSSEVQKNYWFNQGEKSCVVKKSNYMVRRRATDPIFKLRHTIRSLVICSYKNKGWKKSTKTQAILGCDFNTLQAHLIQSAFTNYGSYIDLPGIYHIDHIIPISSATTEEELIKLNHYTNLQYLYPEDNQKKSDKADWKMPEIYL